MRLRKFISISLLVVIQFVYFNREVLAAFSYSITGVSATTIENKESVIDVTVTLSNYSGIGDSYYSVYLEKDTEKAGYTLNNNNEWVVFSESDCLKFYFVSATNKKETEVLKTKLITDTPNGNYQLKVKRYTPSCGSTTVSYGSDITVLLPQTPTAESSPTTTPSPTPIATPTMTPTSTPKAKGELKITIAKDSLGSDIASAKIYLNDTYVHHYTPENFEFCSDCYCDTSFQCSTGNYKVKIEKDGYNTYLKDVTIGIGDSIEINPVLTKISPTSTATSTPTSTKTPTPKPTIKDNSSPTPNEKDVDDETVPPSVKEIVLGIQDMQDKNIKNEVKGQRQINPVSFIFLTGGVSFLVASFVFYKKLLNKNETDKPQDNST